MFPDPIFIPVSGGRIFLKNGKFYPNRPEKFDEKISIFIQTCHEGSWCTFRGPPSIHDFLADGKSDSQLWQGAIHMLEPSIHNLIHAFLAGQGAQKAISAEIAILTVHLLLSHLTISGSLTITRRYKEVYQ
jgi:hypothetical protein